MPDFRETLGWRRHRRGTNQVPWGEGTSGPRAILAPMNSPTLRQLAGPAAAAAVWGLASSMGAPSEMVAVLSAAAWMLVWWVAEAVPLGVTSVLPLVLFPVLGVTDVASAAAPYGSKYVFLFLGGFLIALAQVESLSPHLVTGWILCLGFSLHRPQFWRIPSRVRRIVPLPPIGQKSSEKQCSTPGKSPPVGANCGVKSCRHTCSSQARL